MYGAVGWCRARTSLGLLGCLLCLASTVAGQTPTPGNSRPLADGILRVVAAEPDPAATVDKPVTLPELAAAAGQLDWKPSSLPATETLKAALDRAALRRSVWQLEFGYKPLRTIRVNLKQPDGKVRSTVVWYLVYYVRNAGGGLNLEREAPDPAGLQKVTLKPGSGPVRFLPSFTLVGHDRTASYSESILPMAVEQIRQRELPKETLYDSVSIGRLNLKPAEAPDEGKVWGVATWINVDPDTDFMSVYVQGLTNGYRLVEDRQGPRRELRTLRLNFWRPGDAIDPTADDITFGIPFADDPTEQSGILEAYGTQERLDYEWIYR